MASSAISDADRTTRALAARDDARYADARVRGRDRAPRGAPRYSGEPARIETESVRESARRARAARDQAPRCRATAALNLTARADSRKSRRWGASARDDDARIGGSAWRASSPATRSPVPGT